MECFSRVLILILMEYGLGQLTYDIIRKRSKRLNPCFNGIWSRTFLSYVLHCIRQVVLILVLMEYGLGHFKSKKGTNCFRLS